MLSCYTADVFQPSSWCSTNTHHIKVVLDVLGKLFTFRLSLLNGLHWKGKRPFCAFIYRIPTVTSELKTFSPLEGHRSLKPLQLSELWTLKPELLSAWMIIKTEIHIQTVYSEIAEVAWCKNQYSQAIKLATNQTAALLPPYTSALSSSSSGLVLPYITK